jgi:hypothetical protein
LATSRRNDHNHRSCSYHGDSCAHNNACAGDDSLIALNPRDDDGYRIHNHVLHDWPCPHDLVGATPKPNIYHNARDCHYNTHYNGALDTLSRATHHQCYDSVASTIRTACHHGRHDTTALADVYPREDRATAVLSTSLSRHNASCDNTGTADYEDAIAAAAVPAERPRSYDGGAK